MASLRNGARVDPVRRISVLRLGEIITVGVTTGSRQSQRTVKIQLDDEEAASIALELAQCAAAAAHYTPPDPS